MDEPVEWIDAGTYEGFELKACRNEHVLHKWKVYAQREDRVDKEPIQGLGMTFDGAVQHAIICINREIGTLGSKTE